MSEFSLCAHDKDGKGFYSWRASLTSCSMFCDNCRYSKWLQGSYVGDLSWYPILAWVIILFLHYLLYVPHMYFLCMEIDWVVTSVDFEILQKGNHHFLLELWSMKMRRDAKECTCLQDVLLAWSHWREKRWDICLGMFPNRDALFLCKEIC